MKIFYTECEGGQWIPARVKTSRRKLLKRLRKFAFKKEAAINTSDEEVKAQVVLFSNNMKYYPFLNIYCRQPAFTTVKNYFKWLTKQLSYKT